MRFSVFLGSVALLAAFEAVLPAFPVTALQEEPDCMNFFSCAPVRGDFGIHDEISEIRPDGICGEIYRAAGDLLLEGRIWTMNVYGAQGRHAPHELGWEQDIFVSCAYFEAACPPLEIEPAPPSADLAQTIIHEAAHHLNALGSHDIDEDSAQVLQDECWIHGGA